MANPTQFHVQAHKQLTDILESYHEKLNNLDSQVSKLQQERAVLRTTLMHEIHSGSLKLPPDAIGALAAGCW